MGTSVQPHGQEVQRYFQSSDAEHNASCLPHTYCSNMTKAGMNPKTLQYLMGHSDIGVTLNTHTYLGVEDAADDKERTQGTLLQRSVFSYYSPNDRIYDRIVAVVTHPGFYYVFTTIDVRGLPRFAHFVINLTIWRAK